MPRQCQIVTTEQKERESERKANDKTNTLAKYSTHVDKNYMYLKYIKAVTSQSLILIFKARRQKLKGLKRESDRKTMVIN